MTKQQLGHLKGGEYMPYKKIVLLVSIWCGVLYITGVSLSYTVLPALNNTYKDRVSPLFYGAERGLDPNEPEARWDSYWYGSIARDGYYISNDQKSRNTAFFPLFPLLMRGVSSVTGLNVLDAGVWISRIFLFLMIFIGIAYVQKYVPNVDPKLFVLSMMAFPTSYIFQCAYTEGLFVCLSLLALLMIREQRIFLSTLAAFAAGMTRPTAIALVAPFAIATWQKNQEKDKPWKLDSYLPLVGLGLGILVLPIYTWYHFDNFWEFFAAQATWKNDPFQNLLLANVQALVRFLKIFPPPHYFNQYHLDFLANVFIVGSLVQCFRHKLWVECSWLIGAFLLNSLKPSLYCSARFVLCCPPMFYLWSQKGTSKWITGGYVGVGLILQCYLWVLYVLMFDPCP